MRGQKSRSGPGVRKGFEGGQMPLYRRIPKLRGIAGGMHAGLPKYVPVNLKDIEAAGFQEGDEVSLESLKKKGLINPSGRERRLPLKILGDGELSVKLNFKACAFSTAAKEKLEGAGCSLTVLPGRKKWVKPAVAKNLARAEEYFAKKKAAPLGSPFFLLKPSSPRTSRAESLQNPHRFWCSASWGESNPMSNIQDIDRRKVLISSIGVLVGALCSSPMNGVASAAEFTDMPALRGKDYGKTKMRYPDYTETESGLQYKDLRPGSGPTPKMGETVVVDWDGYTIGYYGRIFEARNKTKGGSFMGDDKDFFKFRIGSQAVIPAFEEAVRGMALGGVRRIIVPPELGYPENDYNKSGPRPTTFSGQRALDFVLRNQGLIDKTLLFDIELLKIIPN